MQQRSNINQSLRKKRRLSRIRKIGLSALYILFLISLCILGLTSDKVRIRNVSIAGNSSVSSSEISAIVNAELNKRYLLIIPTDNYLLLERNDIKNQILSDIKTINSVKISFKNLNDIEIKVSERVAQNHWCGGTPDVPGNCFLMDKTGFVFASSTVISAFPEYFGMITNQNPIGEFYFDSHRFAEISAFIGALSQLDFYPEYFYAVDAHTYQVYLQNGGKILLNDEKTFGQSLINLQALVNDGFIKMDKASLAKINYVDLRYGNRVVCSPAAVCKN